MCGRYYVDDKTAREIEKMIRNLDREILKERGDKHPTDSAAVIVRNTNEQILEVENQKWGFTGKTGKNVVFNARAESITERKMFSDAVRNRRCIIPASGFYEWDKEKNKFKFYMKDNDIMFMAGCYSYFENTGSRRFVIITTVANDSMKSVHDRMPLILGKDMMKDWICDPLRTKELLTVIPPKLERSEPGFLQMSFI